MRWRWLVTGLVVALVMGTGAGAASAQPRATESPGTFGIDDFIPYWVFWADLTPEFGAADQEWTMLSTYYMVNQSLSSYFVAPLHLPHGARIETMRAFYYNNSAEDLSVYLAYIQDDDAPLVANVAAVGSSGTPGYSSTSVAVGHTLNNFPSGVELDGERNYFVEVFLPSSPDLALRGVRFTWRRQVSPAPQTATFGDVPTDNAQFQYIEALAASRIIAGCGNGNYCPDNPLTRGQMAVFLAKALGLHWALP